jgi:hypothetical protein
VFKGGPDPLFEACAIVGRTIAGIIAEGLNLQTEVSEKFEKRPSVPAIGTAGTEGLMDVHEKGVSGCAEGACMGDGLIVLLEGANYDA